MHHTDFTTQNARKLASMTKIGLLTAEQKPKEDMNA